MTDKLRDAAQQALTWFEWFHKGSTIESPASSSQCSNALRAALAQQDAQAVPQEVADALRFYANGDHVHYLTNLPNKPGFDWAVERDRLAAEGFKFQSESNDGAEWYVEDGRMAENALAVLNAAPTPTAQRVTLTEEEIGEAALSAGCDPDYDDGALVVRVARAVIEAYERKNGVKP